MKSNFLKSKTAKRASRQTTFMVLLAILVTLPLILTGQEIRDPLHKTAFAASGSYEVLIDHDDNPNTPQVREFAGADRYETSLAAVERYVMLPVSNRNSNAFSPSVTLASGESLIDAAAGASFRAGTNYRFPLILLTPPDKLHTSFVEYTTENYYPSYSYSSTKPGRIREEIGDVLGGNAVLPDAIVKAVRDQLNPGGIELNSPDGIRRFAGMNRFETAALLAVSDTYTLKPDECNHLVNVILTTKTLADLRCFERYRGASYCGNQEDTAVLVAGDSEILTDLIPAGPFSYAMEVPILLTSTHGLPEETAKALSGDFAIKWVKAEYQSPAPRGLDVYTRDPNPADSYTHISLPFEHVVIIGGSYSIPDIDALEEQVRAHGIKTVTRLVGATPAETSVVLAKELERCLPATLDEEHAFDLGSVALISETALADGISMGITLGVGLQNTFRDPRWTTPALLVGDTLPTAVRDYLREKEVPVKIWAIGGEAAVSSDVVDAAVAATNGES